MRIKRDLDMMEQWLRGITEDITGRGPDKGGEQACARAAVD